MIPAQSIELSGNNDPGYTDTFLDTDGLEVLENTKLSVCQARKHDGPVLPLGDVHEWDSLQARPWQARTVMYDEEDDLFKCWYDGTDLSTERWWATGYAVSQDGFDWHKPDLGLFDYGGRKDNNICTYGWGPVVKDRSENDPRRRYKMIRSTKRFRCSVPWASQEPDIRAAYSPDGIHWAEGLRIAIAAWNGARPDVVALLLDEREGDSSKRVKVVWQSKVDSRKAGPEEVRAKNICWGPDIEKLGGGPVEPVLDPNDGSEHENHFVMLDHVDDGYVMPYEYGFYVPDGTGVFGRYVSDVRLAVSRNGIDFKRINPGEKIIPRGDHGSWDDGFLVVSDKPVHRGDRLYLYYAGCGEDWTSWMGGNTSGLYPWESTGTVRVSRMGVATLRQDGYTCLRTFDGETPGQAVTKAFELPPQPCGLTVNAGLLQQGRSWIKVSVLPERGQESLSGYDEPSCRMPLLDGVNTPVQWKGGALGDAGGGGRIRLKFHIYGKARLYAFHVDPVDRAYDAHEPM